MKFKCSNIEWDIDVDESLPTNLPSEATIEFDDDWIASNCLHKDGNISIDLLEEELADGLSNHYGFAVNSFKYTEI